MTSISGTIRLGEATPTVNATARRQRGGTWPFWLLMLVLWVGSALLGGLIGHVLTFDVFLSGGAGALVGIFVYARLCRRLAVWRFRRTLTGKGVPLDLPVRFEITPDAFVYEVADVRMIAKWSVVSEVFYQKGWWIFLVQSDPWFAADRFFATDADKRAFLGEVLSHMSADARARSPAAVTFAQKA